MDSRVIKSNHPHVEIFAQLDLSGQVHINKLPNEMLRAILHRVPAHSLIRFRLVSNRWNAVIESICREKKCLMIMNYCDKYYISQLSTQFNCHFKLSEDFVFIKAKYNPRFFTLHLSGQLCTNLAKLFPRIEQLYIIENFTYSLNEFILMLKQWSTSLTTLSFRELPNFGCANVCVQINQMSNLKKLHLNHFSVEVIAKQLAQTFARIEHFSGSSYSEITEIVPHFGAGFTSYGFSYPLVTSDELVKLHNHNDQFVSSLVRLSLVICEPQVLQFICEHFSSLQMLRIDITGIKLTTDLIEQLARLTYLTELRIDYAIIDLTVNFDVVRLNPFQNIRTISLMHFQFAYQNEIYSDWSEDVDVYKFCRVLSNIFPNVQNLIIKSGRYKELGNLLEPHLNLFVNLRSHDFGLNDSIGRFMGYGSSSRFRR